MTELFKSFLDERIRKDSGKPRVRSPSVPGSKGGFELATLLEEGEKDSAIHYLEEAAQGSKGASLSLLGLLYAVGEAVEKNPERAFDYFQKAALSGDSNGEYYFAVALREGFGCRPNFEKSFAWLRLAARSGHPDAAFSAAQALENGLGVPADADQAEMLFEQAALSGHRGALERQIRHCVDAEEIDLSKVLYWTRLAAAEDDPEAMLAFARFMLESEPEEYWQPVTLLERAASLGHSGSMCELSMIWLTGRFTGKKDMVSAMAYAHMASSAGSYYGEELMEECREQATQQEMEDVIELLMLGSRNDIISRLRSRHERIDQ